MRPIDEIKALERQRRREERAAEPPSQYTRKMRYFKDGGKIARETPGWTLEEVKESRRLEAIPRQSMRYFKSSEIKTKYYGKTVREIKLTKIKEQFPSVVS